MADRARRFALSISKLSHNFPLGHFNSDACQEKAANELPAQLQVLAPWEVGLSTESWAGRMAGADFAGHVPCRDQRPERSDGGGAEMRQGKKIAVAPFRSLF